MSKIHNFPKVTAFMLYASSDFMGGGGGLLPHIYIIHVVLYSIEYPHIFTVTSILLVIVSLVRKSLSSLKADHRKAFAPLCQLQKEFMNI